MLPFELDLKYNTFSDEKKIKYKTELPPYGNKTGFNLFDDDKFTITYIIDTIPNSPAGHQLTTQSKENVRIMAINIEYPIKERGEVDEVQNYQN